MISFNSLGSKGFGNLGNQLFQIASTIGIGARLGEEVSFPEWKYEKYFENKLPQGINNAPVIKEKNFHFDMVQWNGNSDLQGWLQSEKYFENCKEKIREQFKFKKGLRREINNGKESIAISIRRGDYVNNPNYCLLPPEYYIGALLKYFPNYKDYNIIIFSDDMDYCKVHFHCLENVVFAYGNDIEQLYLMSKCDHFIIANSTFSWWGAWLGEKQDSIIVKPNYLFGYEYGLKNNAKDFYPERWKVYDHVRNKIDLSDVTFIIPVRYDHFHRLRNLDLIVKNLKTTFECNIIIGEQGGEVFNYEDCLCVRFDDMKEFHRTKMLNALTEISSTNIVINYDADVLIPPLQIVEAVNKIRNGVDFVYPYDGRFARVPRLYFESVSSFNDVGIFCNSDFKGTRKEDTLSFGGCVAYNRESFFSAGGENERFISYSPEDWERVYRFKELGYKVERVNGILYHLDHWIGVNSSPHNPFHAAGMDELKRIQKLKGAALRKEVDSWIWAKKK